MKISERGVVWILLFSTVLLLGTFFWPFILNEVIRPISRLIWLLLRIFVLSIGQKYYWGAIIFVALFCLVRILSQVQIPASPENSQGLNATDNAIEYWRNLFTLTRGDAGHEIILKRELIQLMLSLYASKQHTSANFEIYDALQRGEIPLPKPVYTFLFLNEPKETERSLIKLAQSIRNVPIKWLHRQTGQETAEYYRRIDEVLSFLETSLEMENDDGKTNPTRH